LLHFVMHKRVAERSSLAGPTTLLEALNHRVYADHMAWLRGRANYVLTQSQANLSNIRPRGMQASKGSQLISAAYDPYYGQLILAVRANVCRCLLLLTCVILYENAGLRARG